MPPAESSRPESPAVPPAFRAASSRPNPVAPAFRGPSAPAGNSQGTSYLDGLAASAARVATAKTGRPTSASEIKTLALVAGGFVACCTALLCLLVFAAMVESAVPSSGAPQEGAASGDGFGNSFEDRMVQGFHEQGGSLNYTTGSDEP